MQADFTLTNGTIIGAAGEKTIVENLKVMHQEAFRTCYLLI